MAPDLLDAARRAAASMTYSEVMDVVGEGGLLLADSRALESLIAVADDQPNPCPFTLSHTRHWCGYPLCRDR